MSDVLALLDKELRLLRRDKRGILSVLFFTALVSLLLFFGLAGFEIDKGSSVPIVVWLAALFGGTLQLNRTFDYEREEAVMDGLKMIPNIAGKIYISKFVVNTAVIFLIIIFAAFFASILFNYSPGIKFIVPIILGGLSMSAVGTTFSSMVMAHHKRDILLPVLFYPLLTPIVIAVIKTMDTSASEASSWLKIIIVFNVLYITISYLVFESVIKE